MELQLRCKDTDVMFGRSYPGGLPLQDEKGVSGEDALYHRGASRQRAKAGMVVEGVEEELSRYAAVGQFRSCSTCSWVSEGAANRSRSLLAGGSGGCAELPSKVLLWLRSS